MYGNSECAYAQTPQKAKLLADEISTEITGTGLYRFPPDYQNNFIYLNNWSLLKIFEGSINGLGMSLLIHGSILCGYCMH